jgi:hypothetical protein
VNFALTEFSEIRQNNALKGTKFIGNSSPVASVTLSQTIAYCAAS